MNPTLEVLHVPDCPNVAPLLERLRQVTELPVTTREISSEVEAATFGMAGSPTLLVNGRDPFADPAAACGIACRIYRDEQGGAVPAPSVAQLRDVLAPGAALSDRRSRARPLSAGQKAVHQAILRTFGATGSPPQPRDLDAGVLAELHDIDAIRLAPDGGIAVAYPFSATPTRYRVRIGDRAEVYAMCAIDALGIFELVVEHRLGLPPAVQHDERNVALTCRFHASWEGDPWVLHPVPRYGFTVVAGLDRRAWREASAMNGSAAWAPVDACTLPTEERPLREAEFDGLFATALSRVERPEPDRLRLTFDGGAGIEDLVARESSCCSFFDFEITATKDGLVLDVRVPAARVAVLDGLARRAAAARTAPEELA